MASTDPIGEVDTRFSSEDAVPIPWSEAQGALTAAEVYWLSTVRADGRPHVTPLIAIWNDDALHFCTGPGEQKARNIASNANCILTTGSNALNEGLDLVVEGEAVQVREEAKLHRLADAWESKYGPVWHFDVRDGAFHHEAGHALVYGVAPTKAFGFRKGESGSQTRWRFGD